MESSKRIFVVLSTILFLEASAFDSFQTYPSATNNYNGMHLGSGPLQSTGFQGLGSTYQTSYQGANLASNSQKSDFQSFNSGPIISQGPGHIDGSNIGQENSHIFNTRIAQGATKLGNSQIGQVSHQFTSSNTGQGFNQIGDANFGQGATHISSFNLAQGSKPVNGFNIAKRPNNIDVSNIGQGFKYSSDARIDQRAAQINGLSISPGSMNSGDLSIGQGFNQFGSSNVGQGDHISRQNFGQGFNHISGTNSHRPFNQISPSNIAHGSTNTAGSNNVQTFPIQSNSNSDFNNGLSSTSRGNFGQGLNHISGTNFDNRFNQINPSNIALGSIINTAGSNNVQTIPIQSNSNSGFSSGFSSTLNTAPTRAPLLNGLGFTSGGTSNNTESIVSSGTKIDNGSQFNSGLNAGSSLTYYPSQHSTRPTQQLLPTYTSAFQNYDNLTNHQMTSETQSSSSFIGSPTNNVNEKFKIVHVPVNIGSQSTQTLKLPITGNIKYKVLHMNAIESTDTMSTDLVTKIKQTESDIHKVLDLNQRHKVVNYHRNPESQLESHIVGINIDPSGDKPPLLYQNHIPSNVLGTLKQVNQGLKEITSTGSQYGNSYYNNYNNPANNRYNQPYSISGFQTSSDSKELPSIYDINFNKNTNPDNVMGTIIHAESEVSKILKENEKEFQLRPHTVSTAPAKTAVTTETVDHHSNLLNSDNEFSLTSALNYLPYGNSQNIPTVISNNAQATASATIGDVKPDVFSGYNINTNKNILSNNVLNPLQLADLELNKVLQSVNDRKVTDNQRINAFTPTSSALSTASGTVDHIPLSGNGNYYHTIGTMPTYNLPYGYGNLAPSSVTQSGASTSTGITTQNGYNSYGNDYYPNYSTTKQLTGMYTPQSQHFPNSNIDSSAQIPYSTSGTYTNISTLNNFGNLDHGHPKQATTNTAQTQEFGISKSDYIADSTSANMNINSLDSQIKNYTLPMTHDKQTSIGNFEESTSPFIQNNNGLNYPIYNIPPPNTAELNIQQSTPDTTNQTGNEDTKLSVAYTDTTRTTSIDNSESESLGSTLSTFYYPQYSYSLYPHKNTHPEYFPKYSPVYGQPDTHNPKNIQLQTTDFRNDKYAVANDQTLLENLKDTTLLINQTDNSYLSDTFNGTQLSASSKPSDDNKSNELLNSVTTSAVTATPDYFQSGYTSLEQTTYDQGAYSLYNQNYGPYPRDTSLDAVVSNDSTETDKIQDSTSSYGQASLKLNNKKVVVESFMDSTNEEISYDKYHHKYFPIYGQHVNHANNQLPQTTKSSVDNDVVPNDDINDDSKTESYSIDDDDNAPKQTLLDNANNETQDSLEYESDDKLTSTITNTETEVTDSSTISPISKSQNINYHSRPLHYQPGRLNHHRYLYGGNHPRYHDQNKYGHPQQFGHHKFINLPSNSYIFKDQFTNPRNEPELFSREITNEPAKPTESNPLFDIDDPVQTQTATILPSQSVRRVNSLSISDAKEEQETIIGTNQREFHSDNVNSLESNDDYYSNVDDNPLIVHSDLYYNNQQILVNNLQNNAGDYSSKKQIYNQKDNRTAQQFAVIKNDFTEHYNDDTTQDSDAAQLIKSDKNRHSKATINEDYSEIDIEKITKNDTSLNKLIEKKDTIIQKQDLSMHQQDKLAQKQKTVKLNKGQSLEKEKIGIAKVGTILNTKSDGTRYSCAFDALMNIIDKIENILTSKDPQ